jgi:hypothetical protein
MAAMLMVLVMVVMMATDATPAYAEDAPDSLKLIIAGTIDSADSSYSYAGFIAPIWGGQLGQGWFSVTTVSYLTYRYSASGAASGFRTATVRGTGPGVATGLGYGWKGDNYAVQLAVQGGFRDIGLSPLIPSDAPVGTVLTAMPQLQARYSVVPQLYADLISNYTFGQHSAYTRLRLGFSPDASWSFGPEAVDEHGPGYRVIQEGFFITKDLGAGVSIGVNGGQSTQAGTGGTAYIGLTCSKAF